MISRILRSALKVVLALGLFLLTLELVLAFLPDALPTRLANYAYSKYGSFPGGMYFHDRESGINFLRPAFETETYFNGYRWLHSADENGFRRPASDGAGGVLLLGDSMIYGHGLDQSATLAQILRHRHDIPAYNMARQGDSLYQSYVLLRLNADSLAPSSVVLFVFLNDLHDLTIYRTEAELQQRPEGDWDYEQMRVRLQGLQSGRSIGPDLLLGLSSIRLLRGIWQEFVPFAIIARAEAAEPAEGHDPEYVDAILEPATFARTAAYYEAGLADLRDRFDRSGTDFLVVDLAVGADLGQRGARAQQRLSHFLARTCARLELNCATTEGLFDGCPDCFLPGDGHLSEKGQSQLAAWTARRLAELHP